ncbi:GNAT family N-acetyltransferase [Dyella caseinilytica]|uniref:GNAT family N-acetyltransferase n=1 Tax=Dyella caseinilytica TaxID=1849581 RepID=A0ABX7GWE4_9GAMM|nr:GNAT family N-acetyltransferase [Dyella caseinilytica]QRN54803.1 GNAT family N-acetyltransferase [Dyella caseinilytica]GFZ96970.1 N-acetyltransferase [Dyella caseinilytica]
MLVRPARPEDALDVANVHVRSWQAGYRGLLPDVYLDALRAEDRAQRYDFATQDPRKPATLVAVTDGTVRGFATTSPARDKDTPEDGELCALYVDPDYWGTGIGATLINAARTCLFEQGFRQAVLWLLAGNTRAERFYRKDGWLPDARKRTDVVWGITVHEVCYCRRLDAPLPSP